MYVRSKWRNQFRVRDHHIRTRGLFAGGSPRPRPRSPRWGRPRPAPESPCRSRDLPSRHLTSLDEESLGRPTVYCVSNVAIEFFDNICTLCCCADKNRRKSGGRSEHTIICELLRVFANIFVSQANNCFCRLSWETRNGDGVSGARNFVAFWVPRRWISPKWIYQHMRVKLNTSTSFAYRF